jgi:hypothetical protein
MSSFYEWMENTYDQDELEEIAQHGCASGCAAGLIYYSETSAIYHEHAEELHERVGEYIAMVGDIPSFIIENFNSASHFRNAMVWLVAEIYAQELSNV